MYFDISESPVDVKNLKFSFLSETWVYFLLENVKTIKNPSKKYTFTYCMHNSSLSVDLVWSVKSIYRFFSVYSISILLS